MVTGANKGIGFGIAKHLGLSGWQVIIGARDKERAEKAIRELQALDIEVSGWVNIELTDLTGIEKAVEELEEKHPDLSLLVNNAGIEIGKDILHMTFEEFKSEETCNLESVFLGMKHCHDLLLKGENPNIINVSSIAARKSGPSCGNDAGYSATKAAVCLLSRHAAYTYAPEGIRVNAILPGGVRTAIVERDLAGMEGADAFLSALNPLPPHLAEPEDIAEIAWFVGSKGAFMTGSEIVADGGNLTH